MTEFFSLSQIDVTASTIRERLNQLPSIGLILGSGLGALSDQVEQPEIFSASELPNWPVSTVMGHMGKLVVGNLVGQRVMVMQGRVHYYEGYSMAQITFPVRVMQRLGIHTLIVTNAAGGVNPAYEPGDVMLITDHLNFIGMSGLNPLRGPNLDQLGPRFPDMSMPYDRGLRSYAEDVAIKAQIRLQQGVYASLAGPSFESPAELRFLKVAGVDAVGMSTVPEVIVARHGGMRVLGFSAISNKANLDSSTVTTHEEVLEAGKKIVPQLLILIRGVLERLAD